jgi:hypothetical protein
MVRAKKAAIRIAQEHHIIKMTLAKLKVFVGSSFITPKTKFTPITNAPNSIVIFILLISREKDDVLAIRLMNSVGRHAMRAKSDTKAPKDTAYIVNV